jgi:hypothetical protein
MMPKRLAVGIVAVVAIVACQHPSTAKTGPAPASAPATKTAEAPATGQPGATTTPRPRPPRLSPDSLAKLRRVLVNQVLASIAGHENEPAGQVFKNVTISKDMPAAQFVNMMDSTYGRALGWRCENCHVTTDFSSDAKKDKGRGKTMQIMTNYLNSVEMPKISPQNPAKVTCLMCHRGTNEPKDTVEMYRTVPPSRPPGGN